MDSGQCIDAEGGGSLSFEFSRRSLLLALLVPFASSSVSYLYRINTISTSKLLAHYITTLLPYHIIVSSSVTRSLHHSTLLTVTPYCMYQYDSHSHLA